MRSWKYVLSIWRNASHASLLSLANGPIARLFLMTCWVFGRPQDGVRETGVSVAFTVRAMDAGPVLAQERVAIDADVQAPELLRDLFKRGTRCGVTLSLTLTLAPCGIASMILPAGVIAKACSFTDRPPEHDLAQACIPVKQRLSFQR